MVKEKRVIRIRLLRMPQLYYNQAQPSRSASILASKCQILAKNVWFSLFSFSQKNLVRFAIPFTLSFFPSYVFLLLSFSFYALFFFYANDLPFLCFLLLSTNVFFSTQKNTNKTTLHLSHTMLLLLLLLLGSQKIFIYLFNN